MSSIEAPAMFRPAERAADNEVVGAIKSLRLHLLVVAIFSSAINLLYLSSPLYLMQVYNRVLVSESIPTLVLLTLILVIALLVMAVLDSARTQMLIRCGILLDRKLSGRLFSA